MFESRVIVRVTADNPLTCPEFLDRAVEMHLNTESDLTHYLGIPLGTGVEVISLQALSLAYHSATSDYDKEHVTPYIYKNRCFFKVLEPVSSGMYYSPKTRVTVDTQSDLQFVRALCEHYSDQRFISMEDIVRYDRSRQEFPQIPVETSGPFYTQIAV